MKVKVAEALAHPALVSFPQGIPSCLDDLVVTAAKKSKDKMTVTAIIDGCTTMSYKGTNFGDSSKSKNSYKFAVGAVDPARPGVMQVFPVDHTFVLRPSIHRLEDAVATGKLAARMSIASASERRESLTNEFGSKKKKRALQAMKSNIISAENISAVNELEGHFTAKSPDARAEVVEAAKQALASGKKRKRA